MGTAAGRPALGMVEHEVVTIREPTCLVARWWAWSS
jgi:hypothetical protein